MHDAFEFVISLDAEKARALATLLKHFDYSLCRGFALNEREGYMMIYAVNEIRMTLGRFGFMT